MPSNAMQHCIICPRNCGVDRNVVAGFCGAGAQLKINLATLHHGEEPPISGSKGSGTMFFSWCNLRCVYCQNYNISALGWGKDATVEELCKVMLGLQDQGAHNINLVTPTHYTPQIIEALRLIKDKGLTIPVVWNSSAYEKVETLKQLHGLVDIYLPDYKYAHGVYAAKYSHAADYPTVAFEAIKEMFRQKGLLQLDKNGIARMGVMVRLLVLPSGISGTIKALQMLEAEFGKYLPLSIMAQYYPAGTAVKYSELNRGITQQEYQAVLDAANELGFESIYAQELSSSGDWTPGFVPSPKSDNLFNPKEFNPSRSNNDV